MNITVICIGKLKEKYLKDACEEYKKRLSKYISLNIIELKDEKAEENNSSALELMVKDTEGAAILRNIKEDMYVIALAIEGMQLSSEQLSQKINELGIHGKSNIAFVIGGSLGLSQSVLQRADFLLSFSKMTFPHQLMRLILLEQTYRSFKIIKNEPYHK